MASIHPSIQVSTPPSLPLSCIQPSITLVSHPLTPNPRSLPSTRPPTSRRHLASQLAAGIHPSLPSPALRALQPGRSTATPTLASLAWPTSLSLSLYCTLSPQVPADPDKNADCLASDGVPGAASLRLGLLRTDAPPLGFSGQQATEVIGPLLSRMSGGVSSMVVLKATVITTAMFDIDHKLSTNGCSSDKKFMAVRIIQHAMEIIHLLTDANSIHIIVDAIIHRVTEEAMLPFCLFPALTMVVQRVRHVVHLTMDVQQIRHVVHDRSRCLVYDRYGRSL